MKKMLTVILMFVVLLTCSPAFAQIDVQSTQLVSDRFSARIHINPDKEPVYIVLDQIAIGGIPFDAAGDNFSDMWSGYPQGSERRALTYEFFVQLEEGYAASAVHEDGFQALMDQLAQDEPVAASFRITLLAPKQEIVPVDCSFSGDSTAAWKQIDGIVARGDTPVEREEPYNVRISSEAFDEIRYDEPVCFPLGNVDALTAYANLSIAEQKVFSFSL